MKCLFVGGPADGKWIETNGERYCIVTVMAPLGHPVEGDRYPRKPEEIVGTQVRYTGHLLRDYSWEEFWIYTPEEGNGMGSLLKTLMEGYHPGNAFTGKLVTVDHRRFMGLEMKPGDTMPLIERGADTVTLVFHPPIR